MEQTDGQRYLKWGIVGIAVLAIAFFVTPILATIAWNLVSLLVAGCLLAAGVFLIPTLAEFLAHGAWKAKELLWRADPVTKLWRDLHDFDKEIDTLEVNIASVATEEENAKSELRKQRIHLDTSEVTDWESDISNITEAKLFLMSERDQLREDYKDMERLVRKSEAHWKMGKALGKAADAVNAAGKIAAGTVGGRVSMDEIQARLANGRAKLAVIKSRRTAADVRQGIIDVKAKEVASAALANNPSPVIEPGNAIARKSLIRPM